MAQAAVGMDKGELRHLLSVAAKQPVCCAIGQGKDATTALLLLDKIKSPKALERELLKQDPTAKNTRFGMASVKPDVDAKLITFTLNRAAPGAAKRLIKALKGTAYNKVAILLEDGSTAESADAGDEAQDGAEDEAEAGAQEPVGGSDEPVAAAPDLAGITTDLTALVKRLAGVITANPAAAGSLTALAKQAQADLKAGDAASAQTAMEALRHGLDAAAPAMASKPGQTDSALGKARDIWLATRAKVESDIAKLQGKVAAAYAGHDMAQELEADFAKRVEPVLGSLDKRLAGKLDEIVAAGDGPQRAKLVAEARAVIDGYVKFLDGDDVIAHLDANPLVPIAVRKTLDATLGMLGKVLG